PQLSGSLGSSREVLFNVPVHCIHRHRVLRGDLPVGETVCPILVHPPGQLELLLLVQGTRIYLPDLVLLDHALLDHVKLPCPGTSAPLGDGPGLRHMPGSLCGTAHTGLCRTGLRTTCTPARVLDSIPHESPRYEQARSIPLPGTPGDVPCNSRPPGGFHTG